MDQILMNEVKVGSTLARLAHEIIEQNPENKRITLLGVKERGNALAELLQEKILQFESEMVINYAQIDPYPYRDDIKLNGTRPQIVAKELIDQQIVILVDDVLYTGRTMRAAIDGVLAAGRAKQICLAVLVDRGHREIPLHPDFVGKNLPTNTNQRINVKIDKDSRKIDSVVITEFATSKKETV